MYELTEGLPSGILQSPCTYKVTYDVPDNKVCIEIQLVSRLRRRGAMSVPITRLHGVLLI